MNNWKEQAHRTRVLDLIAAQSDEEIAHEMKQSAYSYRQLRTSLIMALGQMRQIQLDFGWEDDTNLTTLREMIASLRNEELDVHEMLSQLSDTTV